MHQYRYQHKPLILVVISLAAISVLVLITPGRAADQPTNSEGWIDFGGSSISTTASLAVTRADATSIDITAVIPGIHVEQTTIAGSACTPGCLVMPWE